MNPSPALALLSAIALAMVARLLFGIAEAGPSADIVMPVYPFVIGALALIAARYAVRTWRAQRSIGRTLALLALLIDLAVIGFALVILLLMTVGGGIA